MKKVVSILLALAMVFALVACGGGSGNSNNSDNSSNPSSSGNPSDSGNSGDTSGSGGNYGTYETDANGIAQGVKIALIGSASGGSFWGNIETGFNETCAEYGWDGSYFAPAAGAGDVDILNLCETALIQGFDVICPVINDASMFEDFVNRANEAGILVIAYNSSPGEEMVPAQLGIDSYNSGYQQGEMIAKYANERSLDEIVAIDMRSYTSVSSQGETHQGILDAIAANYSGTVTEVGQGQSEDNAATAQDNISAMFIANPNINAIFCCDSTSTVGAAQYIEEQKREGEILVFGLALDAEAFLRVRAGSLTATSSVDTYSMGGPQLLALANAILTGGSYEYKNFPDKIWVEADGIDAYCAEHGISLG